MSGYRRAGSRWRLLVHRMRPGGENGAAVTVSSHPNTRPALRDATQEEKFQDLDARYSVDQVVTGCEFDELVVGEWLHVEQMDAGRWWLSIGGIVLHVHADRDGRPREVRIDTEADRPVQGCSYLLDGEPIEESA